MARTETEEGGELRAPDQFSQGSISSAMRGNAAEIKAGNIPRWRGAGTWGAIHPPRCRAPDLKNRIPALLSGNSTGSEGGRVSVNLLTDVLAPPLSSVARETVRYASLRKVKASGSLTSTGPHGQTETTGRGLLLLSGDSISA